MSFFYMAQEAKACFFKKIILAIRLLSAVVSKFGGMINKLAALLEQVDVKPLRTDFERIKHAGHALQKLIDDFQFSSVLDVGSGSGEHFSVFANYGKRVTGIDYGASPDFKSRGDIHSSIIADFNVHEFDEVFDCVWCSHVMEHQLNVGAFLKKIHEVLREGGVLALTVPPQKNAIVGGHLSLWNAGLVLYQLVLAGFDCSEASVLVRGYNISVIVKKKSINVLPVLVFDSGDILAIKAYLPHGLEFIDAKGDVSFDGDVRLLNWN